MTQEDVQGRIAKKWMNIVEVHNQAKSVLLLSADQKLNKNQREAYLKHLREPGGFLDRIKHLVALQEMGKDLHCLQ